ncbi:MAG: ribonuclease R [Candidatus Paceibacterota bacterium]
MNNEETHTGQISTNSKGFGFFRSPELENDIFISPSDLNQALNGDTVTIKITGKTDEGPFGVVTDIIRRARTKYVGVVDSQSSACFVMLDDKKAYADFYIPQNEQKNAQHGDKVVLELIEWKKESKNPMGKIVEILGKKGDNDAEMRAIVIEGGFEGEFPPEVEAEARKIKDERGAITEKDVALREDFRRVTTLTIDPETAKDFDDALSLAEISIGVYEVGVHIADVSHFVDFGSTLDKEAYERGFSVYLVDRTIPMLPEILSNDLCSLNPHEDKHAFSAIITITEDGEVKDRRFTKSIIHSDKRFSYEAAQKTLNAGSGEYFKELQTLNQIAKKLVEKNRKAGSIEFETDEVTFELDVQGRPVRIVRKERLDTHKLVEEFMLLANREVAKRMSTAVEDDKADLSLYRVHDVPPIERIESYSTLVKALGHTLPLTEEGSVTSKDLGAFLATLDGKAEESLLKTAAIRSMSKATYSTQNIGHYGLAFAYYTHFTSPIRRYADLVIHRLLYKVLKSDTITSKEADFYFDMIPHITERESAAVEAERTSVKYKHVEFMLTHVGETFEGTVTGISEWGIYVEENETKAEGMVSLRSLDDHFTFERESYRVIGEKTKKVYRLGDPVTFKVARADLDKKQLDYEIV